MFLSCWGKRLRWVRCITDDTCAHTHHLLCPAFLTSADVICVGRISDWKVLLRPVGTYICAGGAVSVCSVGVPQSFFWNASRLSKPIKLRRETSSKMILCSIPGFSESWNKVAFHQAAVCIRITVGRSRVQRIPGTDVRPRDLPVSSLTYQSKYRRLTAWTASADF